MVLATAMPTPSLTCHPTAKEPAGGLQHAASAARGLTAARRRAAPLTSGAPLRSAAQSRRVLTMPAAAIEAPTTASAPEEGLVR